MKKTIWLIGVVLAAILLVYIGFQWLSPAFSAKALTEEEAKNVALERYSGEIIKTTKQNGKFQIELQAETGLYQLEIDANSGDIITVSQLQKQENQQEQQTEDQPKQLTEAEIKERISSQGTVKSLKLMEGENPHYVAVIDKNNEEITLELDAYTGETTKETPNAKPLLEEEEAIEIAKKEFKKEGEVEDVEFFPSGEPTPYYLVEIEGEDDEKTYEIDAYTGALRNIFDSSIDDDDDDSE